MPDKLVEWQMSDEKSGAAMIVEAHEEFIQHIERGSSKIRMLAIITIVITAYLALSYVYQLLTPYLTSTRTVTVNLLDPGLEATEVVLLVIVLAWMYVAVRDYLFTRNLTKAIEEARQAEKEIEKRITG